MKSLAVVIIAILLTAALIPSIPIMAWHTPCSTEDYLFEKFGPRTGNLTYRLNDADFQAFLNKEIDIMDRYLTPDEYNFLETIDPLHEQYSNAFTWDFMLCKIDINNQVLPTNMISVRQALSHIIDKQYFIDTYLSGMGHKADSPCAHAPGWYNPACEDLYNRQPRPDPMDIAIAYDLLMADIGPPVPDPEDPTYYMWNWTSPFPDVGDGYLLMWANSEDPVRIQLGNYVKDSLESYLPTMLESMGLPRARIHVDLRIAPHPVIYQEVMVNRHFHLYTSSWGLGREPFHGISDYIGYPIPEEWNLGLLANRTFPTSDPQTASYHIWRAQAIIMGDAAIIPMFNPGGYKAYLSSWRGIVNEPGMGICSQWSFLNAHRQFSASNDTMRYGTSFNITSTNIITASMPGDLDVLGRVYDVLINYNPYNFTEDIGQMAKKWTSGFGMIEFPYETFHLRSDMYWQDIPPRMWRKYGIFPMGISNVHVTPIDVAFSIIYVRDTGPEAQNYWLVQDVGPVEISPCWKNWTATPETPPFNASYPYGHGTMDIIFNPNLGPWEIRVWYQPSMSPWLDRLHPTGALPIIPYHIWWWVPNWDNNGNGVKDVLEYDPWLDDTLYGCGPYIFVDYIPNEKIVLLPFREGVQYRGIVSSQSYYNYIPVQVCYPRPFQAAISKPNKPIFFMPCNVKTWLWGYNLYIEFAVVNFMAELHFDLLIEMVCTVTNIDRGETIIASASQSYTLTGYNVPSGEWYRVFRWMVLLPLTWKFNEHLTLDVRLASTITGPPFWGEISNLWMNWTYVCWPTWPGNCALIKLKLTPGDLNGDGIVDIKDATLIGLYWQQTVPPAPPYVDQNCDGRINIIDASIVGVNWQKRDP